VMAKEMPFLSPNQQYQSAAGMNVFEELQSIVNDCFGWTV